MATVVTVQEVKDFVVGVVDDVPEDPKILEAIELVQDRLEDACRCAFIPQTRTEQVEAHDGKALLSRPLVIEVLEVDGEESSIAGPFPTGRIPLHNGDRVVKYRHGWEETPRPIKRAALLLIRDQLTPDPSDFNSRATSVSNEEGSFALVTPGVRGAIFPIPEVNQIVRNYAYVGDVV
ncbi:MAG TPA: hypothetical protein VMF31_10600 [Solirubrobacterales bacterium]|nr:hypothetical protein [Solirubrobacterales bacterium]